MLTQCVLQNTDIVQKLWFLIPIRTELHQWEWKYKLVTTAKLSRGSGNIYSRSGVAKAGKWTVGVEFAWKKTAGFGGLCENDYDEGNKSSGEFHDDEKTERVVENCNNAGINGCVGWNDEGQLLGGLNACNWDATRTLPEVDKMYMVMESTTGQAPSNR